MFQCPIFVRKNVVLWRKFVRKNVSLHRNNIKNKDLCTEALFGNRLSDSASWCNYPHRSKSRRKSSFQITFNPCCLPSGNARSPFLNVGLSWTGLDNQCPTSRHYSLFARILKTRDIGHIVIPYNTLPCRTNSAREPNKHGSWAEFAVNRMILCLSTYS